MYQIDDGLVCSWKVLYTVIDTKDNTYDVRHKAEKHENRRVFFSAQGWNLQKNTIMSMCFKAPIRSKPHIRFFFNVPLPTINASKLV